MTRQPYTVLIGGPGAIGSRITGSIPRALSAEDRRRLRATLDSGLCIQVVTISRATWLAMAPALFAQIGVVAP